MQRRGVRFTIYALIVIAIVSAAVAGWDAHVRAGRVRASDREVDRLLDRMSAATAALGAAQQAYVAQGQQRGEAMTRASVMVQQIYDDMPALRLAGRSPETGAALLQFGKAMDALVNIDDRVRDHLRLEQELMGADLVYTEARDALETMAAQLETIREGERGGFDREELDHIMREAAAGGAAALVCLLGALALVKLPRAAAFVQPAETPEDAAPRTVPPAAGAPTVDLAAAARVCSELSRMSSASALPATLARAARVLDASGLVVWLGAGDELFPAAGHGYGQLSLARLGPIPRTANNATAAAWRDGALSLVSGDAGGNGAIVAPLYSQSGCVGVMAAEVRHGREHDPGTQAVATIIAAQIATVVAPWPAASGADDLSSSAADAPAAGRSAASA